MPFSFRGLNSIRDAMNSVFLYHAVPKGLNMSIVNPGGLPKYIDIDSNTRKLCEDVILNKSSDVKHVERFLYSLGISQKMLRLDGDAALFQPLLMLPAPSDDDGDRVKRLRVSELRQELSDGGRATDGSRLELEARVRETEEGRGGHGRA